MQENSVTDVLAVSVEQQEAMDLHLRIKANLEMAAASLLEVCRGLKEMKEGEGYKALGFAAFEDYTVSALGIKSRMAYYYISTYDRLGPELLAENAGIGITKLRLLSEVTPFDRDEFLEDNDLAGMSVEEIREAVKERNGLREQLSMYKDAGAEDGADERSRWLEDQLEAEKAARARAEEELAALATAEEKGIQASEESIRAALAEEMAEKLEEEKQAAANEAVLAAMEEAAKEKDRLVREAKKEAKEKAERAAEKKLEETRAAALEEGRQAAQREMDAQLAAERAEKEAAAARAAELEKKLDVSASTETTAFTLHFDQMQQHFAKMVALLEDIQQKDEAAAEKLAAALEKGLELLKGQLGGEE